MTEQKRREGAVNFLHSHQVEMRGHRHMGQRPEVIEVLEVWTTGSNTYGEVEVNSEWVTVELSLQPVRDWLGY